MKGLTYSEVLWNSFQGNENAMEKAMEKEDLKLLNGMYYWKRDIHEHITGGKDSFKFGKKDPSAMTIEDRDKMIELLDYAPWASWGVTPNNVPEPELRSVAKPDSDAMHRLQECMDGSKAVCMNVQNMFKELKKEGILASPEAGSIPSLMKAAMKDAKDMEHDHMQPIMQLIDDVTDGTNKATVKHVKEICHAAARALIPLKQHLNEAKALVQRFKMALKKKEEEATKSKSS